MLRHPTVDMKLTGRRLAGVNLLKLVITMNKIMILVCLPTALEKEF